MSINCMGPQVTICSLRFLDGRRCRTNAPNQIIGGRSDTQLDPMQALLWNVGIKVKDLDAEVDYFVRLGARQRAREQIATEEGTFDYALLEFGGTRLFITTKPIFEDRLGVSLPFGLTHIVFEVDDVDREVERLVVLGSKVIIPPRDIRFALGSRRICFLCSPGNLIFEIMKINESLI
jgi:catechol 2,3-dioxygenase-like lactoylglutathione lyase family enzyme